MRAHGKGSRESLAAEVEARADRPVRCPDGLRLCVRRWRPRGTVRGAIGIVHGLYAHGGMFEALSLRLAALGFAVYALDLRGHGRSPGQRGYAAAAHVLRDDTAAFLAALRAREPEVPVFLYGHSLGAVVALAAGVAAEPAPDGVVASAPPFDPVAVPRPLRPLCRALSLVAPRLPLPTGAGAGSGVRDPEVTKRYAADPFRQPWATPRLVDCLLTCGAQLMAAAPRVRVPLLLLHGERDHVARVDGTRAFLARLPDGTATARFYPGGRHELHADTERDAVTEDVARWLRARSRVAGDATAPKAGEGVRWTERSARTRW